MKKLILILTITLSIFAQYEWSDPIMLSEKVTWPDALFTSNVITVDKNGVIHAFWVKRFDLFNDDYSQIMHRTSTNEGNTWSATEILTPQYTEKDIAIGNLNVVCDSENNLHLMYLRGAEGNDVVYMKFDGSIWTEPESIYDFAISNLRTTIDNNDRIYATWYRDPAYFSYLEDETWITPEPISNTYLPSIYDLIVTSDNNLYACGSVGDVSSYRPFLCKYEPSLEVWNEFTQIPGFEENSWASCLTMSKSDTLNVNIAVGPTIIENTNYNVKYCTIDTIWTTSQYINKNTYMKRKDFYRDNDDNLHLFERRNVDSSLVHTTYFEGEWTENIVQHEAGHAFWRQNVFFDEQDQFYTTFEKIYYDSNERAVFFQKKLIEVGIEDSDELLAMNYELEQNYPNPFNNQTQLSYSIDKSSYVNISVYNTKGEFVKNLVNEKQGKGKYSVLFNASNLNSGIYYYRLRIDGMVKETKKMLYLR
ncbi:MAG: T9SS type A sorting domain-containing protein [Candidatus Delongbacteria bacterium]|nr:T9SS type A sorting domain-containing protein [Candidatus Delongbacteria bacterium]